MRYLLIFLLLAGCASEAKFRQTRDARIGMTETQLIAQVGRPPDRVYEAEGLKYLQFLSSGTVTMPSTATSYDSGMVGGTTYSGTSTYVQPNGTEVTFTCNVTYVLSQGKVQSYTYQGNNCVE